MPEIDPAPRLGGTLSISRSLQALAVVVVVLIVAATVHQLLTGRAAILADTEHQMARLDMVFAEQTGRAVETVDFILRSSIESFSSLRAKPPIDAGAYDDWLRRRIAGVRQVKEVAITDKDGHILFSSPPGPIRETPPDARAFVAAQAARAGTGLQFSDPLRGPDGQWTALMLRPILSHDVAFEGAAIAFLNLGYFEDFYQAVELNESGAILLHLRDGTVLARYPHTDAIIGESYADLPPFKDILAHSLAGTVIMDSPIDGSRRVLAIRALKAFPLAVNMSVQAIGESVRREEDLRLLQGRARYVDDAGRANDARGYVLRSPHAHARILAIDVGRARTAPGVLAVLTGEDLQRRGLGTLMPGVRRRRRDGTPAFVCPQPLLAQGRVRYVGDPAAFVVADTLNQAKDAAELIEIDYEPLPAVVTAAAALAPGAPAVWDENPGNEAFFHEIGSKEAVDAAFARANRVVRDEIRINRVTANSMEPRGCIGEYDRAQDRYTIRCTIQSVHATRAALADRIFKLPQHQFRVVCDNMGGGFGMKGGCYPEYALSLWASEVIGRPVRWISERGEGLADR